MVCHSSSLGYYITIRSSRNWHGSRFVARKPHSLLFSAPATKRPGRGVRCCGASADGFDIIPEQLEYFGHTEFVEQQLGDPIANENEACRHLYEVLIAPAERWIAAGSRGIVFPDDALSWLNFETLPVSGAGGRSRTIGSRT